MEFPSPSFVERYKAMPEAERLAAYKELSREQRANLTAQLALEALNEGVQQNQAKQTRSAQGEQ